MEAESNNILAPAQSVVVYEKAYYDGSLGNWNRFIGESRPVSV